MKLKNLSILVLLAALTFSFASCSSDDDDDSIVGVWQYNGETSYTVEVETNNPTITAAIKKRLTKYEADAGNYTTEFTSDGKYITIEGDESDSGTYTFINGILTTYYKNDAGEDEIGGARKVNINGNKLTYIEDYKSDFTNADGSVNYESGELKSVFEEYAEDLGTLTIQDFTSITKAELIVTLTRK